jgi:hypothetical protein
LTYDRSMFAVYLLGGMALTTVIIVALVFALPSKKWNGSSMLARRRLLRGGVAARAKVLDAVNVQTWSNNRIVWHATDLVLEVEAVRGAYRAPCRMVWTAGESSDARAGRVVPVRIDPADPQRVLVDVAALQRAGQQTRAHDVADHQARQAALLAGAPVATTAGTPFDGLPPDAQSLVQQTMQLCARGGAAQGTIVRVESRGENAMFCVLAIEVSIGEGTGEAWTAIATGLFKAKRRTELVAGAPVDVRYDLTDRTRIAIDVRH